MMSFVIFFVFNNHYFIQYSILCIKSFYGISSVQCHKTSTNIDLLSIVAALLKTEVTDFQILFKY